MELDLNKPEVSKDEYFNRFGENLDLLLFGYDNPSNAAILFLEEVQDTLDTYISANFNIPTKLIFKNMTDFEKTCYKEAVLEQAKYVMTNGDLLNDTGYDNRAGIVANKATINKIAISSKAKNKLIECGIWTRRLNNLRRGRWFYGIIWFR